DDRGGRGHWLLAGHAEQPGRLLRRGTAVEPRALRHADRAGAPRHPRAGHREPAAGVVSAAVPTVVGGALMETRGPEVPQDVAIVDHAAEEAAGRRLAERYRVEFVDMAQFRIDPELFRSIPADLMMRYGFVPSRRESKSLVSVVSDPRDLPRTGQLAAVP